MLMLMLAVATLIVTAEGAICMFPRCNFSSDIDMDFLAPNELFRNELIKINDAVTICKKCNYDWSLAMVKVKDCDLQRCARNGCTRWTPPLLKSSTNVADRSVPRAPVNINNTLLCKICICLVASGQVELTSNHPKGKIFVE